MHRGNALSEKFCVFLNDKHFAKRKRVTLPETNIAPENGWLEDACFLFGGLSGRCKPFMVNK